MFAGSILTVMIICPPLLQMPLLDDAGRFRQFVAVEVNAFETVVDSRHDLFQTNP
jgi:hypothetical protein